MTSGHLNGELAIVGWLEQAIGKLPSPWILGPGDDAAILRQEPGHDLVFTTDMVLENECFRLGEAGPALVGRKALAVNLSDLAAMGAKPVGCLVSLALPKDEGPGLAEELMKAILSL
ncbi:MAG: thiamine-phosphate kinase, partial [Planctomycetota bacterium]